MLIWDVRLSDNPSVIDGSPNGFYAEEICQIMRYAGISGRLKSLGIFNYLNFKDEKFTVRKINSANDLVFF